MLSLFDSDAAPSDPLELRAYTSRLLGREPSLVLHGGGNTSVKLTVSDFFGDPVDALYVKGSGWDLASIKPAGFSPVRLDVLKRMAGLEALTDTDMVREQRAALLEPSAPNPSVEAILHAVIPFKYVDHTHADAVVALTNTPDGPERVQAIYGDRVLFVPYVMPGFVLARKVYELTRDVDWTKIEGMILLHHGVFTFNDNARASYETMVSLVTEAEDALKAEGAWDAHNVEKGGSSIDLLELAELRAEVSALRKTAQVARVDDSDEAVGFASRADVRAIASRGPVTPDHVIRTKRVPVMIGDDIPGALRSFAETYAGYFERHDDGSMQCLDTAPRWAVLEGRGVCAFGTTVKAADQVRDIARHTARVIQWGEALGGWQPLPERDIFDMEYWELEQRKLARAGAPAALAGQIALVTGAASGIGRASAEELLAHGAAVFAVDRKETVLEIFDAPNAVGRVVDVTDSPAVRVAVGACVREFGGLDILVSNAGDFPKSAPIGEIVDDAWAHTLDLNLSGHMRVLRSAIPFLERGVRPAVLLMASRNVLAPGPGAAAYSASKAALTQLGRVAALELAGSGVRVNTLHPDKIFDTDLFSDEKIELRAAHYGLTVNSYKRSNLLGIEITARDVARVVAALVGPTFRATTGAQIPIDGGNDRTI